MLIAIIKAENLTMISRKIHYGIQIWYMIREMKEQGQEMETFCLRQLDERRARLVAAAEYFSAKVRDMFKKN